MDKSLEAQKAHAEKEISQLENRQKILLNRIRKEGRMCEYIIAEDFTMDKYIFNENNSLWYELVGDYYFPCLAVPAEEKQSVGVWGQRHKQYLKEHRPALYNALLLSGKLDGYLADIDQQAQEMMNLIVQQMAQAQGITEALKSTDQMAWVGMMNNIRASATEIVNTEIIYS